MKQGVSEDNCLRVAGTDFGFRPISLSETILKAISTKEKMMLMYLFLFYIVIDHFVSKGTPYTW